MSEPSQKMKTYKRLYGQITAFENLRQAFKKAARGKRKRPDVADFEYHLEANLVRMISAAPFRDRVVHHALSQVIEPGLRPLVACVDLTRRTLAGS
jgi:hypothetical protein